MPSLRRTEIRRLNRLLDKPENTPKNSFERHPELKKDCWYKGKVVNINNGNPVVFQSSNNPVVILTKCRGNLELGQSVIYQVTAIRGHYAFGIFKEVY